MLAGVRNLTLAEPLQRAPHYLSDILHQNSIPLEEQVEELEKLTFSQFMVYKEQWLRNICMIWLIQGHLH